MSEAVVEEKTMQSEERVPMPDQVTAGTLLRQAREAARIQLPAMAATLKVPQRKLEALEADDYAAFSDHVFMRALAMSMCRTLHVNAEPVLALLPHREIRSLANAGPGINETVKVRSNFKGAGVPLNSGSSSTRKIAAGVLILLAAAAAVYFVPFHPAEGAAEAGNDSGEQVMVPVNSPSVGVVAENASVTPPVAGSADGTGTAPAAASVVGGTPVVPVDGSGQAASLVSGDSAARPDAQASVVSGETATAVNAAAGLLVLKVNTGQSWVKVKDGAGKVVLEKTLNKDESATAEGQLPLSVIVGNAKGTQVTVRGEPLDISSTRDNVARFEVK